MLAHHRLLHRELRLADSGVIRGEVGRRQIIELKAQFSALPPEQQRRPPALLNGLALLETAAGDYEAAQHDFHIIAAGATDPHVLAIVSDNEYQVALEQHDWAER